MGKFYESICEELSLWVRQMAWLSAVPEKTNPKDKREPVSRIDAMKARAEDPLLPPNPASYLTDWLFEIGPTMPTGMGAVPITFGDMIDWQAVVGVEILPWEARVLRRLSIAYVNESYRATKADCPLPYTGTSEEVVSNRDKVSRQLSAMFSGLRKKG